MIADMERDVKLAWNRCMEQKLDNQPHQRSYTEFYVQYIRDGTPMTQWVFQMLDFSHSGPGFETCWKFFFYENAQAS